MYNQAAIPQTAGRSSTEEPLGRRRLASEQVSNCWEAQWDSEICLSCGSLIAVHCRLIFFSSWSLSYISKSFIFPVGVFRHSRRVITVCQRQPVPLLAAIVLCFHVSYTVTFLLPPGNTSAVVCDMVQMVPGICCQGLMQCMASVPSNGSKLFLLSFLFFFYLRLIFTLG